MTNTSKLKKLQKVLGVSDNIFQLVPLQLVIAHISAEMCEGRKSPICGLNCIKGSSLNH